MSQKLSKRGESGHREDCLHQTSQSTNKKMQQFHLKTSEQQQDQISPTVIGKRQPALIDYQIAIQNQEEEKNEETTEVDVDIRYEQEEKELKMRNVPHPTSKFTESDMTIVNFGFGESAGSLLSKKSVKSNIQKKQAQKLQLDFHSAQENTQTRRLTQQVRAADLPHVRAVEVPSTKLTHLKTGKITSSKLSSDQIMQNQKNMQRDFLASRQTNQSQTNSKSQLKINPGNQTGMKKGETTKLQECTVSQPAILSPSVISALTVKENPKESNQVKLNTQILNSSSQTLRKVEPRQIIPHKRLNASPKKLMQSHKQVMQPSIISKHEVFSKPAKTIVQNVYPERLLVIKRRSSSMSLVNDSLWIEDQVAEESRASLKSIVNSDAKQLTGQVRKSYVKMSLGHGMMEKNLSQFDVPMKPQGIGAIKKNCVSPDPAVKHKILYEIEHQNFWKNPDMQSPRQKLGFYKKKMSSPLKINLTKFQKFDTSLSPRRITQNKLVSASMEVDKFQISLTIPKFQRNTSISKLKQTPNSPPQALSNTSLLKFDNPKSVNRLRLQKSGMQENKKPFSFLSLPQTQKAKEIITRKKSAAHMHIDLASSTFLTPNKAARGGQGHLSLGKKKSRDIITVQKKTAKSPIKPFQATQSQSFIGGFKTKAQEVDTFVSQEQIKPSHAMVKKQMSSRSLHNQTKGKMATHVAVTIKAVKKKQAEIANKDSSRNLVGQPSQLAHLRSQENSSSSKIFGPQLQQESNQKQKQKANQLEIQRLQTQPLQSMISKTKKFLQTPMQPFNQGRKLSSYGIHCVSETEMGDNQSSQYHLRPPNSTTQTDNSRNGELDMRAKLPKQNLAIPSSSGSINEKCNWDDQHIPIPIGVLLSKSSGSSQPAQPISCSVQSSSLQDKGFKKPRERNSLKLKDQSEDNSLTSLGPRGSVSQRTQQTQIQPGLQEYNLLGDKRSSISRKC